MSLSGLLPLLHEQTAFQENLHKLSEWQRQSTAWVLPSLPMAARPYVLAALQQHVDASLLVIVPRSEDARRLHEQLLLWSARPQNVLYYPEPDTLPFERVPAGDLSARQRMAVLARLGGLDVSDKDDQGLVIVAPLRAVMHKTLPLRDLASNSRILRRGQRIPLTALLEQWLRLGYEPATLVEEPGQMSHRGGIVDIFPVTSRDPVRLEFFGDEIDSLRCFDPATQRSTGTIEAFMITPPAEVLPENAQRVAGTLDAIDKSRLNNGVAQQWRTDVERLRQGASGASAREMWHFYAPYFRSAQPPMSLLDHFDGLIALDDAQELAATAADIEREADELKTGKLERGEITPGFLSPFVAWADIEAVLGRRPRLLLQAQSEDNLTSSATTVSLAPLPFLPSPVYGGRLKQVLDDCLKMTHAQQRVVITSHQARRISALLQERDVTVAPVETVQELPLPSSLTLVQGSLAEGWTLGQQLTVLSDVEIFGWAKPRRTTTQRHVASPSLLSDLAVGDYVVHIEHGVGIFRGLLKLNLDGTEREYLYLAYAQGDKLYVPTDQIDRVGRYVGAGEATPPLTSLSSSDWEHAKRRAHKAVQEVAKELLAIYAARQVAPGTAFSPDTVWQGELEASFPYIETPDQLRAINEVKYDMELPQPMDRLICGDVGYGKTEVALRAAFKAVMESKQVAILVPTTILAQQHYNTFCERMAAFPVCVEMLSRFRSEGQQRKIIANLREGNIDICIGTHRLIQKDVVFKNLGMVIIDEEQRFGVMHKERLKQLRKEVDVLTLTATPIPRTLHMSLVGVRDMSVIDTPPEDRLPITTVVSQYDENLIRQAIMREMDRGGQVYFVHNRVQSIEHVTHHLQTLLPNVQFAIGHGQMPEDQLEHVMIDFAAGKIDVLVCTAIIESGVDIANVNTIIINRADQFGLAQLYQLRGRVGRGANRAYAYLLHDRSFQLSETAEQRLRAIFEASTLGAGYRIAMKDLEIRGSGNILGVEQHGHIAAIGFDLYTRLLAAEVERLKEEGWEENKEEKAGAIDLPSPHPSVTLPLDAFVPIPYVEDDSTRLALYQRMATISTVKEVEDMRSELVDRFGKLPPAVENLFYVLDIRARADDAGVTAITGHEREFVLTLATGIVVDQAKLTRMFGPALKIGTSTMRLDRRKVGGRWREQLRTLLDAMAAG